MEYLLSLAFTLIDILCMVFFLDAFATRRWTGVRFWGVLLTFVLLSFGGLFLNRLLFFWRTKHKNHYCACNELFLGTNFISRNNIDLYFLSCYDRVLIKLCTFNGNGNACVYALWN